MPQRTKGTYQKKKTLRVSLLGSNNFNSKYHYHKNLDYSQSAPPTITSVPTTLETPSSPKLQLLLKMYIVLSLRSTNSMKYNLRTHIYKFSKNIIQ